MSHLTGIDVDIDVEHEGQRAKVVPPPQTERGEEDLGGGANDGGGVKPDCSTSVGTQVSSAELKVKNVTTLM